MSCTSRLSFKRFLHFSFCSLELENSLIFHRNHLKIPEGEKIPVFAGPANTSRIMFFTSLKHLSYYSKFLSSQGISFWWSWAVSEIHLNFVYLSISSSWQRVNNWIWPKLRCTHVKDWVALISEFFAMWRQEITYWAKTITQPTFKHKRFILC